MPEREFIVGYGDKTAKVLAPSHKAVVEMVKKNKERFPGVVTISELSPQADIVSRIDPRGILNRTPLISEITQRAQDKLTPSQAELISAIPQVENVLTTRGFLEPGHSIEMMNDDLGSPLERLFLSRSNKVEDQLAKLREFGFEAAAFPTPSGQMHLVAKDPKTGHAFLVDSPFITNVGDLADVSGNIEEVVGGLTGAALTRGVFSPAGGTGPLTRILTFIARNMTRAAGAGIGEGIGTMVRGGAEEALDRLFTAEETQSQGIAELLGEAGKTAAIGSVGELAGSAVAATTPTRLRNLLHRSIFQLGDTELRALRASRDLGFPELYIANVHPIARHQAAQAASVLTSARKKVSGQVAESINRLNAFQHELGRVEDLRSADLYSVVDRETRALKSGLAKDVLGEIEPGIAFDDGFRTWLTMKNVKIGDLYDQLRDMPQGKHGAFDLTAARNIAEEAAEGIPADVSYPIGQAGIMGPRALQPGAPYPSIEPAPGIFGPGGEIISTVNLEQAAYKNIQPIRSPQLKDLINTLRILYKNSRGQTRVTDLDVARRLRTWAFNLKDDMRLEGYERRIANRIHTRLQDALENPIGGSEEFTTTLREANREYREMAEITDMAFIRKATAASQGVGGGLIEIGREALRPWNVTQARTLHSILPPHDYKAVTDGYKMHLLDNPGRIEDELSDLANQDGLRYILTRDEREAFLNFGRSYQRFQRGPVMRMVREGVEGGQQAFEALERGGPFELESFMRQIGKDTPQGRAVKAGFLAEVLRRSSGAVGADRIGVDPRRAAELISRMDQEGSLAKVFDSDELERIRDIRAYLSVLPIESGTGDSLVGAELASSTKIGGVLLHPYRFVKGQLNILSNYLNASIILSDQSRKVVKSGVMTEPMINNSAAMGAASSILFVVADRMEKDVKSLKDDPAFVPEQLITFPAPEGKESRGLGLIPF